MGVQHVNRYLSLRFKKKRPSWVLQGASDDGFKLR